MVKLHPTKGLAASDSFQRVLKLAFDAFNQGRFEETEAICRVLMQIEPKDPQTLFLLGMVLHKTQRDQESIKWLSLAAEIQPGEARIHHGLGCARQSLGDHRRAIESFAKCLELEPDRADVCYSLGNARYAVGEIEAAAALFRRAVELNPQDQASWNNLGKSLLESNRLEESLAAYDRVLAIDPGYALARYGRAIALLTGGRLEEGFREYEVRLQILGTRQYPQPLWKGEPIEGKTLFLHAEQGFGDAIQEVRFVPQARQRAARVILECRPELKRLFAFSACADVVIAYGEAIPPFDCFTSVVSLPGIFGVTQETVPRRMSYLKAPLCEKLPSSTPGNLKVGLVWAGNPGHHNDASRSLRLEAFAPILQTPGVVFYSLQVPVPASDEPYMRALPQFEPLGRQFADFLDTAGVIGQLDLIISVDTAVAHLAGALGKPVWTLLPFAPDWRWFLGRSDTVWYPTMRLFRQSERGRWDPVIQQVAEDLWRLAAGERR